MTMLSAMVRLPRGLVTRRCARAFHANAFFQWRIAWCGAVQQRLTLRM